MTTLTPVSARAAVKLCSNCGKASPLKKGRCRACYEYHHRTGKERPPWYGTNSRTMSDDAILERLVALNTERAAEEARGHVRWLRPDYQAPDHTPAPAVQPALLAEDATAAPAALPPWPTELAARAAAVRVALAAFARPVTADEIAQTFEGRATKSRRDQVTELLETLTALGQARLEEDGRWSGG